MKGQHMPTPLDQYYIVAIDTRNNANIGIRPNQPMQEIDMIVHDGIDKRIVVNMHPLEVDALILALQTELMQLNGRVRVI